jgi:hypothetical protein
MNDDSEPWASVFLRVEGNEEFEVGRFRMTPAHVSPGVPVIVVMNAERPLARLLRRVADVIETEGDLPVPDE